MQAAFGVVFIFLVLGVMIGVVALTLSSFLRPKHPTALKQQIYECGETPVGTPWMQFNNRFYTVALVFILFDVEVVFLYPWAVVFKELGFFAWLEMAVFVLILAAGLAYAWVKGDLEWVRSRRFLRAGIVEKGPSA
jgi:NADH-quinone oxidoreductase subunit A